SGSYKLAEVATYYESSKDEIKARFNQTLLRQGEFQDKDKVSYWVDWSQANDDDENRSVKQDWNVPRVVSIAEDISFTENRYYRNRIFSRKSWSWSASGSLSL